MRIYIVYFGGKAVSDGSKRTTVILDKENREFLDKLIREGKESGIKDFLTKMIDIYRNWCINDWKYPGECYVGVSRVAFSTQENINTLVEYVPKENRYAVGRKMGESHRLSFLTSSGLKSEKRENWNEALMKLRILGFGDFMIRNGFLSIRNPFINDVELLRGFLEELLGSSFAMKTSTPPRISSGI